MNKKYNNNTVNLFSRTLNRKNSWKRVKIKNDNYKLNTDLKNWSIKYAYKKLEKMNSIKLEDRKTPSLNFIENLNPTINNKRKPKNIKRVNSSLKKNLKIQENNKKNLLKLFNKSKANSIVKYKNKNDDLKQRNNEKKDLFNFDKKKIKIGQNIYYGIYKVIDKRFKKKYLIKEYKIKNKNISNNDIKYSKTLKHENLLKFNNNFEDKEKIYLLFNCEDEINLEEYLKMKDRYKFSEKFFMNIFKQILLGLNYLHNNKLCHGDLKIENIFYNIKSKKIKIGNFENIITINDYISSKYFGSFEYMCPEILGNKNYNSEKAEIWSIGILFFRYLYSIFPYRGKDQRDLLLKINNSLNFPSIKKYSKDMENLIKVCLHKIPNKRLSIDQLLKLNFFN